MGFKRLRWRCEVMGCGHDAELSFVTVISTGGNRRERLQVYAPAVRLCMADAKILAAGHKYNPLARSIHSAIDKLTGGDFRPGGKRARKGQVAHDGTT